MTIQLVKFVLTNQNCVREGMPCKSACVRAHLLAHRE